MFDFSVALELLKQGKKLARTGWNGKGLYVELDKGGNYQFSEILPFFVIKNSLNSFNTWVPSVSDLLADDWDIAEIIKSDTYDEDEDSELIGHIITFTLKGRFTSIEIIMDKFSISHKKAFAIMKQLCDKWKIIDKISSQQPSNVIPVRMEDLSSELIHFMNLCGVSMELVEENFKVKIKLK